MTSRIRAAAVAGLLLAAAPLAGQEATPEMPEKPPVPAPLGWHEAGALVLGDTSIVLAAPLHWDGGDWLKLGEATVAIAGLGLLLDNWLHDASQRSRTTGRDDAATTIQKFGAEYSWGILGAYAAFGLVASDRKALNTAVDGALASAIANAIWGNTLKLAVGRARPKQDLGPTHFDPFSGDASFPSGHTTQAFAVASVIAAHDGRLWVKVVAFGIAGSVGLARIHQDEHWTSDVVAGAILGTAVGAAVVKTNDRIRKGLGTPKEEKKVSVSVTPLLARRGGGIQVSAAF